MAETVYTRTDGGGSGGGTSDLITIDIGPGAIYTTLQSFIDNLFSSGYISGGAISDSGSGEVDVASGQGYIKIVDSEIGNLVTFGFTGITNLALTDNAINYIYIDYNAGSPQILATTIRSTMRLTDQFPIGIVYRQGTVLQIIQDGVQLQNFFRRECERSFDIFGFYNVAGGIVAEKNQRYLISTAGTWYLGVNKTTTLAQDTTLADRITAWYRDGVGGWTQLANQQQVSNLNYDNNTGTPVALTAGRYGVFWVYICYSGTIHVVYGQGDYTLIDAQNALAPSSVPPVLRDFSKLQAKIIVLRSATNFLSVQNAASPFDVQPTSNHNDLINIQGGLANEYYHLNSADYAIYPDQDVSTIQTPQFAGLKVGTASINASALIELVSTTKGLLLPRMTTAQRDLIGTPGSSLTIFNTTTNQMEFYDSVAVAWKPLGYFDAVKTIETMGAEFKEPNGVVNATDSTLSFVNGTRTFSIAPTGVNFQVYVKGKKFTYTVAQTVVITDTEGLWYFYFNATGVLTATQTMSQSIIVDNAIVSSLYWDATNNDAIYGPAEERHGCCMTGTTHYYLHRVFGSRYISGGNLSGLVAEGTGNTDGDLTFALQSTVFADEDITNTTIARMEADLLPKFYRNLAGEWRSNAATAFPGITTGTGRLAWNDQTQASGLAEVSNTNYALAHIVATNDAVRPFIILMGQAVYTTVANAQAGALTEINNLVITGLPFAELVFMYTIILQTSTTYTSTIKSRVRSTNTGSVAVDFRKSGLNLVVQNSGTPSLFTSLIDVPINYTGAAAKLVTVNAAQTGLEFTNPDFLTNVFRASDNTDTTKKVAINATNLTTASVRNIIMADADVDLRYLGQDVRITASPQIASLKIGTAALNAASLIDVVSTTKGTRPFPSMTSAQRAAIVSPVAGLMVYDTTENLVYYYGTAWIPLGGGDADGLDKRLAARYIDGSTNLINTNYALYTAPASTFSVGLVLTICNQSAVGVAKVRIAHIDGAIGAIALEDYWFYDVAIAPSETVEITIPGMIATDTILIRSDVIGVSFVLNGQELTRDVQLKRIAAKDIDGTTNVINTNIALYTSTVEMGVYFSIANRNSSGSAKVRVAIIPGAIGTVVAADYVIYDMEILANETWLFDNKKILLNTYTVLFRSSVTNVNMILYRVE